MTLEQLTKEAIDKVKTDNLGATNFRVKFYDNVMNGKLLSVSFQPEGGGKEDSNHIYFGDGGEVRSYRWYGDVLNAVSYHKERIWFFRLLEFAGIGGVIAFTLVIILSILLCVLAFSNPTEKLGIVDIVKTSFTIILGYFFGSQVGAKK